MTEEAEAVSAVEQTVAREVRREALKEEETEEVVSAVEQTVARVARADVPKAEEAETTVSAEQTVVARRRTASGTEKRRPSDAVFTPELTKTSKDSKSERDRENKNKKKDFEKKFRCRSQQTKSGWTKKSFQTSESTSETCSSAKTEEKKQEVKDITLPEKVTIRELAEAMKMQPSVIVKKLFMEGIMVTVNHEIDFEKAEEIALDYDIIAEQEEKVDVIEELSKRRGRGRYNGFQTAGSLCYGSR